MSARHDHYDVIRLLATGGMASVHLARDRNTGGMVVLKAILPELATRPEFVAMFAEEARLMAGLAPHPHVVQLLDAGQTGDGSYQVLQFVDGPDLGVVLAQLARLQETMPVALATWISARVADGLHHVHTARDSATGLPLAVVHRDVSPANVLLSRDGDVRLADFGIASFVGSGVRTETGVVKGKAAYLSPEQCAGGAVDARSDVFALGIVLHELLTGRRLFSAPNPLAIIHRITSGPIPPPSAFNPHVDGVLDDIVGRALARDPARRFQTAGQLAAALDAWRAGCGEHVDATLCARWLGRLRLALPPTVADVEADVHAAIDALPATTMSFQAGSLATVPDEAAPPRPTTTRPRAFRRVVGAVATAALGVGLAIAAATSPEDRAPVAPLVSAAPAPPAVPDDAPDGATVNDDVGGTARPVASRPKPKRSQPARGASAASSSSMGRLSVRTTPPTVVSAANDIIDSTPFVGRPVEAGLKRLTLENAELGIRDEIVVKVPKDRNLALIATWAKVDDGWVLSTKTTREYR